MSANPRLTPVTSIEQIVVVKKVPEMVRAPAHPPMQAVAISSSLFALPTHYDGSLTRLCGGKGKCDLCGKRELRTYMLVGVIDKTDNAVKWVQLTPESGRSLLKQLQDLQLPLFGAVLRIGRERKVMSAPVTCVVDPYARVSDRLPMPIDPQETIDRVFGTPDQPRQPRKKRVQ